MKKKTTLKQLSQLIDQICPSNCKVIALTDDDAKLLHNEICPDTTLIPSYILYVHKSKIRVLNGCDDLLLEQFSEEVITKIYASIKSSV